MSFLKHKRLLLISLVFLALLVSLILYYEKGYPLAQSDISDDLYGHMTDDLIGIHNFTIENISDVGNISTISFTFLQNDDTLIYYGVADYEKSLIGKYRLNGLAWATTPFDI